MKENKTIIIIIIIIIVNNKVLFKILKDQVPSGE